MKHAGLHGVRRGGVKRTTIADSAAPRPANLVQRRFGPTATNQRWVADMTYVSTWSGLVYVAFVVDASMNDLVRVIESEHSPLGDD
jgi:putative transposase